MSLLKAFLFVILATLTARGPVNGPVPAGMPSQIPAPTLPPAASPAVTPAGNRVNQIDPEVRIWSLGGNGWALRIGDKLLIFDYVGWTDPDPPAPGEARDLRSGHIDPDELGSSEVYVFVTHSHQDHFDPVIFEWQDRIDRITYFFGWQAADNPEYHYLIGPRAQVQAGGMEVYTINSNQDGVPEVAYLLKVDGITIYHNGDYRAAYREDFEYLQTITDHIDIAFVIGWPYVNHQHFLQAQLLAGMFNPAYMFAICREGDEENSRRFAELLAEHGVETTVLYAEQRGDTFIYSRSTVE